MVRVRTLHIVLISMIAATGYAADGGTLMLVGTYTGRGSEGIYCYRFNPASGEIDPLGLAARTENPSFLVADPRGRHLYAVNEIDTFMRRPAGAVSVFSIDRGTSTLKLLQQVSSLGSGPAHLSLDRSSRFLMVANYGGGSVCVFPLGEDGRIGRHTAFLQAYGSSVNAKRQAGPHAHFIQTTMDNRLAIVADLGSDKLLVYDFDERSGTLTADSLKSRRMPPGSGPRHAAFSPSGKHVYVVNELSSSVTVFAYDAGRGSLSEKQTLSTLPAGFSGTNTTAEIIVDARGMFLYVSNRGEDSIVVYSIDAGSGTLTPVHRIPCGGRSPRNIALDPSGRWLACANARSDTVTIFQVGQADGRLTATGRAVGVTAPVCVMFVPPP